MTPASLLAPSPAAQHSCSIFVILTIGGADRSTVPLTLIQHFRGFDRRNISRKPLLESDIGAWNKNQDLQWKLFNKKQTGLDLDIEFPRTCSMYNVGRVQRYFHFH